MITVRTGVKLEVLVKLKGEKRVDHWIYRSRLHV